MTRDIVYEKELAAHIDRMVGVLESLKRIRAISASGIS